MANINLIFIKSHSSQDQVDEAYKVMTEDMFGTELNYNYSFFNLFNFSYKESAVPT